MMGLSILNFCMLAPLIILLKNEITLDKREDEFGKSLTRMP